MKLQEIAKSKRNLFWSTSDLNHLSDEAVVEGILEYGDLDDVNEVIAILGFEKTAAIFFKKISAPRHNFDPKIENYFKIFFSHARKNPHE